MVNKKILISFLIILIAGFGLILYNKAQNKEIETASATLVIDAVNILSPFDGKISKITAHTGDNIKIGDIIAEISEHSNSKKCSRSNTVLNGKKQADKEYTDAAISYKDGVISKEEYDKELAENKNTKKKYEACDSKDMKYIHAPQDGIVDIKLSEGNEVSKDAVVAVLKEHKEYVRAYISPKYKKRVKPGRKATISIVKYPEKTYSGEVTDIGSININGLPINISINETISDLNLSDGDYVIVKLLKK